MTAPGSAASASNKAPADAAAKAALAWLHSARFLTTASQLSQLPPAALPEIAFVGRSNAGKSTAINTLAQHKRLAFSSRTPGRTQHINLFEVGPRDRPDALLADLPGYGYAAVERSAKLRWQRVMADYLRERVSLAGVVLLADARLGLTELDRRLLELIAPRLAGAAVRLLVLLTKADKLNRRDGQQALREAEAALAPYADDDADVGVSLFSALSRTGLDDVARVLHGWHAGGDAADDAREADDAAAAGDSP
ncbi:MAG: YihA family ribosome biogenesis GTP-binding protein [Betaproteobacteria bacterium]|nr:YihA family ribosome biogenesis GTP-binding protein [Betaproteobacteria bacterium]MCC6247633.1 YihA family ribosome biogenesis GTP-binding protein [Rubrivivax sp.]MCL4697159.1 ribosome biogenesis GTP-binding protein YihA/YsxC [Burkholderiaceae bacterium]